MSRCEIAFPPKHLPCANRRRKEGGRIIFHGLFPAASISGEGLLVPQIGVELSKWPLTTRGVEGARERRRREGVGTRARKGCSWDSWFGFRWEEGFEWMRILQSGQVRFRLRIRVDTDAVIHQLAPRSSTPRCASVRRLIWG